MKIEQLIVQHLYHNKKVTLQGIGTITLNPAIVLPAENDKDKNFVMPDNAFEFEYNLKAVEDEALISYIVQHTSKILPLASADLDSYVMLAKQFLNIGKPLLIEGVGTIQKNQAGDFQFTPGHFVTPRIDDIPKQLREKRDESVSFESEGPVNNTRRNGTIFFVLLLIAAIAFGIYYFTTNTQSEEAEVLPLTDTTTTPIQTDTSFVDTTARQPVVDTTLNTTTAPAIKTDNSNFKIVLKTYPSAESAQKAFKKLTTYGHKLVVVQVDSFNYQLAIPFFTPVSDTTRARDSLKRFFGGKPFVKL